MDSVDGMQRAKRQASVKNVNRVSGPQSSRLQPVRDSRRSPNRIWKVSAITLGVLIVLGVLWYSWLSPTVQVKPWRYQAVFLTNGQVYFGKLSGVAGKYVTLRDVYYLQSSSGAQAGDNTQPSSGDMNLVKLGEEIHGPEDKMKISRDQILFWENLKDKDGSKVVDAITNYKKSSADQPAPNPIAPAQPGVSSEVPEAQSQLDKSQDSSKKENK